VSAPDPAAPDAAAGDATTADLTAAATPDPDVTADARQFL